MLPGLLVVLWMALPLVLSQSNYASQGNSIEYQPGLPPSTVLNGKVTKLDDISSMIFLNRTKAYLNCSQGSMQVELKFEEPFYGVAYADFDRNSACIFKGRGSTSAKLELPLKGTSTIIGTCLPSYNFLSVSFVVSSPVVVNPCDLVHSRTRAILSLSYYLASPPYSFAFQRNEWEASLSSGTGQTKTESKESTCPLRERVSLNAH